MRIIPRHVLLVLLLPLGCAEDKVAGAPPDAGAAEAGASGDGLQSFTLTFEGRVGSAPFDCARPFSAGTPSAMMVPLDFRFYVHDMRLVRSDGGEVSLELEQDGKWQYLTVALLDFENREGTCDNGTRDVRSTVVGRAPAGTYQGVRFKLGVPFALNHADAAKAPSPLNLSSMFWSWNGGYKFLRVDARLMTAGTVMHASVDAGADPHGAPAGAGVFNVHVGSTGCMGDPGGGVAVSACANPNLADITLGGFDPSRGKIIADYAALVASTNLAVNRGDAPGCMSGTDDPECASIMPALGIDLASGRPAGAGQVFFRKE